MAINTENPETFGWICRNRGLAARCVIPGRMEPFVWDAETVNT
jgi:hypothetical protein